MTDLIAPETIAAALGQFAPTPEQSAVISAPLAPTLVVAGAGSGKTETMSARVVWLVANGLVRRDQVLGLTFTRKAAGELAERIQRRLLRLGEWEDAGLVPMLPALHASGKLDVFAQLERDGAPEAARRAALRQLAGAVPDRPAIAAPDDGWLQRPTVATYNSFADTIVRENAVRIGRDPESAILTDSAAWLLMRRIVHESDDPRLEDVDYRPSTIIDAALQLARDAADNLVDLDELTAFAQGFGEVTERPSQDRRTTVYADVRAAATRVGGLEVLAELAREYDARKRAGGLIDFSDQVSGALSAVRSHPAVGAELRDRYRMVLLDEYQDTSVVQTDLLAELFRGEPVMAVGDPHQSIYGWRGASAGNLGGFAGAFGGSGDPYTLLTSWRNSTSVLDAANAVLAPLAAQAPVPVGELRARPLAPEGTVEIEFDGDVDAEAARVAEWFSEVRSRRTREGNATTGAVLFRAKKHMVRFADALAARGIPHRILGLGGLLSTPEVVDVVSALRVIDDPTAGSALIRLLSGPRWGIGVRDLRALADLSRRLARHDPALQPIDRETADQMRRAGGDEGGSLIDALDFLVRQPDDHGWLSDLSAEARTRLREAGSVFAGLRRAAGMPIPELIRVIERELRLDIELAANEARGPARTAGDQLRAFIDEIQAFRATDERGSLTALLSWLDRAERLDEFAPRTEPPEPDVVQLLTIHGSKGLEWDAVAVVRCVTDELPARPRDGWGWLRFGVLPYPFRGDRTWLPRLRWSVADAPTQQDLRDALTVFKEDVADRQLQEERRLAYVAVTRARDHLLLTGSAWSGTRAARAASPYLHEIAAALESAPIDDTPPLDDPFRDERRLLSWPLDPLGARRARVAAAAARVRAAQESEPATPSREVELLLGERATRVAGTTESAPARIPASRFKDFAADYEAAVAAVHRPMPERPYRQTRLGTLFHSWVEQRSGMTGRAGNIDDALWESDDDSVTSDADRAALDDWKQRFLGSEWAGLRPLAVETEIDFTVDNLLGDGRPHIVICKLDAVYEREGRIEIVDWKTGRPPRTAAERAERMLQLDLYRRAYHERFGTPLDQIDVVLYYVADDLILRG